MTTAIAEEHEDKLELTTLFCDSSTDIRTYETSVIGKMNASTDFLKVQEMGGENDTVFAQFPHVVEVKFCYMSEERQDEQVERFACPCKQREAKTG